MRRIWIFLTDRRTLFAIGFLALACTLLLSSSDLEIAITWAGIVFFIALLIWIIYALYQRRKRYRSSAEFNDMLEQQANAESAGLTKSSDDVDIIRSRMQDAIRTIKTSKLGLASGSAALYELPWYMVIGNPAAGKSTAIMQSGLQFPLADKNGKVINGIGGTRNCDWFFTTDGIFLDTAGRYSVHEEDRKEWFGFLSLLRKHRKLAPINGVIIAVSISELTSNKPEFAINLAKNLRQRVQELTEKLEVFAPVYIVFTKADKISGFSDFFENASEEEKNRVWGATKAYSTTSRTDDVLDFFDESFDELYDGLKQMSLATMSANRSQKMPPGTFTFPLEFSSIKTPLRSFIATLFEENPFQFKPILRGFYLTSALQEEQSENMSADIVANRFNLDIKKDTYNNTGPTQNFFLFDLFRKVIGQDKNLVTQYASKRKMRMRYSMFFTAATVLGLSLAAWTLSYNANTQLTDNVKADLEMAVKLQDKKIDLQSRFEALDIIQARIEQLDAYKKEHPLSLGFGLYQGEVIERKLREEYFHGINEVMVKPITNNLEAFLTEVNASASELRTAQELQLESMNETQSTTATPFKDGSPTNAEDAYNALKTYLMLSNKSHAEAGHLNDQLARFWRNWLESNRGNMSKDNMIRSAEKMMSFYLTQIDDISWPTIENKPSLVDQTRENIKRVMQGMPARDRIYAEVKARAATRFPAVTVSQMVGVLDKNLIVGSYVISGAFTHAAWKEYVSQAFKDAANEDLQTNDWVLKTSNYNDLTLQGSPEQIQKSLVEQYKQDYTKEWKMFIKGVSITEMTNFNDAVEAMNRLGDPQTSPLDKVINTIYDETSWDNPSLVNAGMGQAKKGFVEWFKQTILRRAPSRVEVDVNVQTANQNIPMGPIGKEFSGIGKLIVIKDTNISLMRAYLGYLSKLRTKFNQIKNQGDTGPGAKSLMEQTLAGGSSELSESLKFVDEQMLVGMTDSQKLTLRPILVRPLIQAFKVIIQPTEAEINKIWQAQVYTPFNTSLSGKYPFTSDASLEASSTEIAQIFGSEGAIAKFFNSLNALTVRRGDVLTSKTWADMGISFAPEALDHFNSWVTPLSASGVPLTTDSEPQWSFQLKPAPAPGTREYSIEIDGQVLHYRNTVSQWANFTWPNVSGTPGARITAVTFDGREIEIVNFPGKFGFKRLIDHASNVRNSDGTFALSWKNTEVTVTSDLKIIHKPEATSNSSQPQISGFKGMQLPAVVTSTKAVSAPINLSSVSGKEWQ